MTSTVHRHVVLLCTGERNRDADEGIREEAQGGGKSHETDDDTILDLLPAKSSD